MADGQRNVCFHGTWDTDSTFRADIDYCHAEALTKVGLLGIKVWICRGEVYGKRELAPNFTQSKENNRGGNGNNGGKNFRRKKNNNR